MAHFVGLADHQNLPECSVFTLRIQPDKLLFVMMIDKGLYRLDGRKDGLTSKERRQGPGQPPH